MLHFKGNQWTWQHVGDKSKNWATLQLHLGFHRRRRQVAHLCRGRYWESDCSPAYTAFPWTPWTRDKDRHICYIQCATWAMHLSHPRAQTHMHTQWVTDLLQRSDHSWVLTFSHASDLFTKVQTGGTNLSLFLQCKPLINNNADQKKKKKLNTQIHPILCCVKWTPQWQTACFHLDFHFEVNLGNHLLFLSWLCDIYTMPPWKDFSEEFDSRDKLHIVFDSLLRLRRTMPHWY